MLLLGHRATANPDGAEWITAANPDGCLACHFDAPDPSDSQALSIEGLPERPEPGTAYTLKLRLSDPTLKNAGFMLIVTAAEAPAGKLMAVDARTEIGENGTVARSTRAGSVPATAGESAWDLVWTAPAGPTGAIRFEFWANAGNDDQSPFGDTLHHRIWQLPAAP